MLDAINQASFALELENKLEHNEVYCVGFCLANNHL